MTPSPRVRTPLRTWIICLLVTPIFILPPPAAAAPRGGTSAAEARPYDVRSYHLSVALDFEQNPGPTSPARNLFSVLNTLSGEARITLRNASDQPLDEISLILHRLMKATQITVDEEPVHFSQKLSSLRDWESLHVNHISTTLKGPLTPGQDVTMSIRYSGQLLGYSEAGMLYVRETLDPDFTILRSETFCYPQVAQPDRDAVSLARRQDEFDQTLEVTVPGSHVAVYGGELTGVEEGDGEKTYSFSSYAPSGTIILPVAPYRVVTAGKHRIFHFEESAGGVKNLAKNLERAMALFVSWFGPIPSDHGLIIAEIPEFFGAQAGPLIIQESGAFNNPRQYDEFYHELSHLWNPHDIDPKPSRWNEGLATFLQGLVEEKLEEEGNLDQLLSETFSGLKKRLANNEKLRTVAMTNYGREDMTGLSYSTGALFFGLLYDRVGEAALLGFLESYFREHLESGSTDSGLAENLVSGLGGETGSMVEEWFLTAAFAEKVLAAESWQELRESYRHQEPSG